MSPIPIPPRPARSRSGRSEAAVLGVLTLVLVGGIFVLFARPGGPEVVQTKADLDAGSGAAAEGKTLDRLHVKLGDNESGRAWTGIEVRGLAGDAAVLQFKVAREGRFEPLSNATFAGLCVDFHTGSGYSSRAYFCLGAGNDRLFEDYPTAWGLGSRAKAQFYAQGEFTDWTLDLRQFAPTGWDGQAWIAAGIQATGAGTGLTLEKVVAPPPPPPPPVTPPVQPPVHPPVQPPIPPPGGPIGPPVVQPPVTQPPPPELVNELSTGTLGERFDKIRQRLGQTSADLPQMLAALAQGAKNNPQNPEAHAAYGAALSACGDFAGGVRALEQAASLAPGRAGIQYALGQMRADQAMRESDPQKQAQGVGAAIQALQAAAAAAPDSANIHQALAGLHEQRGETDNAIAAWRKAIAAAPDQTGWRLDLSRCLRAKGDATGADIELMRFIQAAGDKPEWKDAVEAAKRILITPR